MDDFRLAAKIEQNEPRHLLVFESKKAIKDYWRGIKRTPTNQRVDNLNIKKDNFC